MTELAQAILDAVDTDLELDGMEDISTSSLQGNIPPIYPVYFKVIRKKEDFKDTDFYYFEKEVFDSFHDVWVWLKENGDHIWACSNPTIHLEKYEKETPKPETLERMLRYAKTILGGEQG